MALLGVATVVASWVPAPGIHLVVPQTVDDLRGRADIAKAKLQRTQTLRQFARITAPFSGVVNRALRRSGCIHSRRDVRQHATERGPAPLGTATQALQLTGARKQFGIGIVLEDIQAQQAVTQARSDHGSAIAEFNKAQYALNKAVGGNPASATTRP